MSELVAVRVARKWRGADDICVLELESSDGGPLPSYAPGAHIDLHLPGGVSRQYSLSRYRPSPQRYQLAILREPASRGGSMAVHEKLKEGDSIQISSPRNLFALAQDRRPALLLAGGIGITPILCMAEFLASSGRDFELHYCGRSSSRMAFLDRLDEDDMSARVHIHTDDGSPEQRLDIEAVLARHSRDSHIYVCGPTGFIDAMVAKALNQGWTSDHIHFERFSNADVMLRDDGSEQGFEIELASTGEIVPVGPDESIIEALARHGVFVETSCEQGICGTCLTGVKAGTPDHRDMYLSEDEKKKNDQFLPCCSRSKTPRLVLDL
ncbi:oxidoreductase [Alcaligenaceae bacterium]|nr:oxidoreductase [Alcaligenaceae bacterium]